MKPAKILFFVDGPAPKPEDFQAAAAMSATVVFRNARAVPSEQHSLEICDGVAGKVPAIYAAKYPTAEEAIAKKAAELKKLSDKVGDEKAPEPKASKEPPAGKAAETAGKGDGKKPPAWTPNADAKK